MNRIKTLPGIVALSAVLAIGWTCSLFAFRWLLHGTNGWYRDGDPEDTVMKFVFLFVILMLANAAVKRNKAITDTRADAPSKSDGL